MFVAVTGLRFAVHGTDESITLLFVLPIALLAASFGARAGAVAGGAGVALVAVWATATDASLTPLGWVTRAIPMLLLGVLVGAASDQLRDAARVERRLVVAEERTREAAEINDGIVQRLVAAKWALEAGDSGRGIGLLIESIESAERLVADLLEGDAQPHVARGGGAGAVARRRTV